MDRELTDLVWRRAGSRCEYCHLPTDRAEAPFQIDHVIAQKHGGPTSEANLALSCYYCNSYKGPNIAGVDPLSGRLSRLFHPRRDHWPAHFRWDGGALLGLTPVGRATIQVLVINHPLSVELRRRLIDAGEFEKVEPQE